MAYQHRLTTGSQPDLPLGKILCVGRNYADHARELGNAVPKQPLLFIKPNTSYAVLEQPLRIPTDRGACHHETELALLIGERLCNATPVQAQAAVLGYGLGLDLTLRDEQDRLKQNGHPWELAKAFDLSCPLSAFVPAEQVETADQLPLQLWVNGEIRQDGNTAQMTMAVHELLAYCSRYFTLLPGDVVMTGTPAGVGPMCPGDRLRLKLGDLLEISTQVAD